MISIMLSMIGCNREEGPELMPEMSGISLTWKGKPQVTYSSATYQLAFNNAKNEYRVYDDKLANWFICRCSETPIEVGQKVAADVSWTGESSTKTFTAIEMIVEKVDIDGLIWLWNASNQIGIVIKTL